MRSPMKSPLEGRPCTQALADDGGRLAFRVMPRELTPFGARLAEGISSLLGLGLLAGSVMTLLDWRHPDLPGMALALGVSVLGYQLLRRVTLEACRVTTVIELGMEAVRVRRRLGWQSYDRGLEHRFLLLPHDETELERRRNELATREAAAHGQVVQKPIYYGDSFHVVLVYAGHRIDLLTVYGRQPAAAIVARLQYCDRRLDEEAKRGSGGANPHAEADWQQSPGGL